MAADPDKREEPLAEIMIDNRNGNHNYYASNLYQSANEKEAENKKLHESAIEAQDQHHKCQMGYYRGGDSVMVDTDIVPYARKPTNSAHLNNQQGVRVKVKDVDSGYAWFILVVMFMLNTTTNGIARVYGLIYAEQVRINYYSREQASWPVSTASTVENLASLLTPALGHRLTWRQIELLGTSLFVMSNLGAWLSDALWSDIICLGVLQGIALSINTILGMAINNEYFDRYRTMAYGISISGSTCGIFFMAPIIGWVLDNFNFRHAYLSIAIIMSLNVILCLFIVRRKRYHEQPSCEENSDISIGDPRASIKGSLFKNNDNLVSIDNIGSDFVTGDPNPITTSKNAKMEKKMSYMSNMSDLSIGGTLNKNTRSLFRSITNKLEDNDSQISTIHYRCAINRQSTLSHSMRVRLRSAFQSGESTADTDCDNIYHISGYRINNNNNNSFESLDYYNYIKDDPEQHKQQVVKAANEANDPDLCEVISLLRNPYLHIIWIMLAIYYYVARIFIIILVDFAVDRGLDQDRSRGLLNYWSYGEIFGRIFLGGIIDMKWLSIKNYIILTCLLLSVSMLLLVIVQHLVICCAMTACIASMISLEYMLINVFIIEYLGQSKVTWSYGIGAFITSILLFVRPLLIGLFRDQLGSYNGLIVLLACVPLALALTLGFLEPWLVRRWPKASGFATTFR